MDRFNLSTRIELFAICTSLETDLKQFILSSDSNINFTQTMRDKAANREKTINLNSDEQILNQLDLKDYVELITSNPHKYNINNDKASNLSTYFDKIVPVRNRVMHTKPLELGDRALLIEVMERVDKELDWIDWIETVKTREIIASDPSKLLSKKYVPLKEYNPNIYHNLPEPEFDDTGYIGRIRDRKEIKELILNNKNQIITIVGNGGVGKSATAVKVLYDLIDDPQCDFECIIWITLKTQTLSKGEFVEIADCIKSVPDIYKFSKSVIITDDEIPTQESLLKFMDDFKVLLVLDNLETINSGDITTFLKNVPDKSKVLITSRHGLGELENRKRLDGLDKQDTITYFRELSKYYGLDLHKRNDDEVYEITGHALYSNPLSIKWFISGVFNGMSEKVLLSHKEELINFCISNVFEKLSNISKKILQIFLLEKKRLSYGAIDYYVNTDDVSLRVAINELLSTYMICSVAGEFVMNDMSREYISINYPPDNQLVTQIFKKRKELKTIMQSVKVLSEQAMFSPNSICANLSDDDKQLATYYLQNALSFSKSKKWEEARLQCEKAMNIAPDFFEIYKIKAFIEAERGEYYGAVSNYEIALLKCDTSKEKAIVCYLFSVFYTIKMQDLDYALEYIEKADKYMPNTIEILLEKARVYMYLGKYSESEELLKRAESFNENPVLRTQNIFASRYAELFRRKAEILENRDYEIKLRYFKDAISRLNSVQELDIKSGITLVYLLHDLSYLYFDEEAFDLLSLTINRYINLLCKIKHPRKNKMCDFLRSHKEDIPVEKYKKIERFINDYRYISNEIRNDNEGVVTKIKEYYGFISNSNYKASSSIYFLKLNAYEDIQVGDYVKFDIYKNSKGIAAKNIIKILPE